jgi:hypothetical protein
MARIRRRVALVFVLALLMVLATMAAAHADTKYGQCSAGGDTMFGTVYYTPQSGGAWVDRVSFTIQDNTRTHNNVYLRLRGNAGATTYWAWTSGDNVPGEQTQQYYVDEFVPRSTGPYVKFHVTFDQTGSDPSCQFYVHLY